MGLCLCVSIKLGSQRGKKGMTNESNLLMMALALNLLLSLSPEAGPKPALRRRVLVMTTKLWGLGNVIVIKDPTRQSEATRLCRGGRWWWEKGRRLCEAVW
jgi:hypothetical protein